MTRNQLFFSTLAVGATLASLTTTNASAVSLFTNPSFENPVLSNAGEARNFAAGSNIGGWSVVGGGAFSSVLLINTPYTENNSNGAQPGPIVFNAGDALNAVDLTGSVNQGPTAGISQTVNLVVGHTYSLSFLLGKQNSTNFYQGNASLNLSINGGASTLFTNSTAPVLNSIVWEQKNASNYVATQASTTFTFLNASPGGSGPGLTNYVGLDLVNLNDITPTATVPEPGAVALLVTSATLGLGVIARRRRKI